MNSGNQADNQGEQSPTGGLAVGDILFTLFRHKYLIVGSVLLGLAAAGIVRLIRPPTYESTAKIYLPYVVNLTAINPKDPDAAISQTAGGGEAIMNTEVEMLKSFDTAIEVATNIGPERILAKYGGGSNRLAAAGVVAAGIDVSLPRAMSLTVIFSHRDPDLVQPVMEDIIKAYKHRHRILRIGNSHDFEEKADEAAKKTGTLDQQIKELKTSVGVPDIRERQNAVSKEYADLQIQVLKSQTELARRNAELGQVSMNLTNLEANALPSETISTYSDVLQQIDEIKKRQRAFLLDDLTTNHPSVVKLEVKMQEQIRLKLSLEKQYPTLTNYISALPRSGGGSNGVPRLDLESELAFIRKLERTIHSDEETLTKLRKEAFRLMELEPKLSELERLRAEAEKDYVFNRGSIEKSKIEDNGTGGVVNMQEMQAPTPPRLDTKKMMKFVGIAFGGCVGLSLAIAFLIDMVLDRSIRRPAQIVRSLRLPVVLTIPDSNRKESSLFSWGRRNGNMKIMRPDKLDPATKTQNALATWTPDNQLQSHIEGLRERVITHFEVRNVDHHPKLVAVTACTEGAGVTTLASGLAAALSRTGNGSVLLVDMNAGEGVTHSFYKGKPGYGPSESIETDSEVQSGIENLSLTKHAHSQSKHDRLAGMLPPGFNELKPKLKANAYDYVIFDMTAISPASVTPRFSGHMDLVLFVIESEKTKDHVARHASELMREARANVLAILNKYHNPVPSWLAHD